MVSLCSLGCPKLNSIDQADLKLRDTPVPTSQMLGLNTCTITPS